MIDVLEDVRDHYRATGLTGRLKTALAALGPEDRPLAPQQLAALDQFHTRGLAATAELGKKASYHRVTSCLYVFLSSAWVDEYRRKVKHSKVSTDVLMRPFRDVRDVRACSSTGGWE